MEKELEKRKNLFITSDDDDDDDEDDDEDDEDEEDEDEIDVGVGIDGSNKNVASESLNETQTKMYDPSRYTNLQVSDEIRNLFNFISHYVPQEIDIEPRLRTFIPDYVATVGDVDAFIKVPFPKVPSGTTEKEKYFSSEVERLSKTLGFTVLDEPNIEQSDFALLSLRLKAKTRENFPEESSKLNNLSTSLLSTGSTTEIDTWLSNIRHIRESTSGRPDSMSLLQSTHERTNIEELMQEWPEEVEAALAVRPLPLPTLDCTLEEYINIICALLDIPVTANKISSLHLLFTLYNEFKSSQHFNKH